MFEEEESIAPKRGRLEKIPLDPVSVADLRDYIKELHEEIARAEAAIEKKQSARGVADSFFKLPK